MPGVDDENAIGAGCGERRIVGLAQSRLGSCKVFARDSLAHVPDHVRLDVEADDAALWPRGGGKVGQEVTGARANISDHHALANGHGCDDELRLLPRVALGTFEAGDPLFGLVEAAVRMAAVAAFTVLCRAGVRGASRLGGGGFAR